VPDLTNDQLTLAVMILAGVALIAFLLGLILSLRLRKLRREYALLRGGNGEERDIFSAVGRSLRRLEASDKRIDELLQVMQQQGDANRFSLQKFGIVRYNAFEEMGGNLSFSLAILDDHGDGLVLTSINGRADSRTYAKPIKGLSSSHTLSDEEREAVAAAVAGYERGEAQAASSR
jgi:Protein of unknown function (DUF4446)